VIKNEGGGCSGLLHVLLGSELPAWCCSECQPHPLLAYSISALICLLLQIFVPRQGYGPQFIHASSIFRISILTKQSCLNLRRE